MKKSRYFNLFISKVLKKINNTGSITTNAKQQLNSSLIFICNIFSEKLGKLVELSEKKTITCKDVEKILKFFIISPVLEIIENNISTSLKTYEDSKINNKKQSRQNRCGLLFPVSVVENILKLQNLEISETAPISLTVILEYICESLLSRALEIAAEDNHARIKIRDLELSLRENTTLNKFFTENKIIFLGGGVVPEIHEKIKNKKKRRKTEEKKSHRFRPGVVSTRKIKKFQKNSDYLTFAKLPFERLVRRLCNKYREKPRISCQVFLILQHYIEQYMINLLRDANRLAIHCGRVKVTDTDIQFIHKLRGYSSYEIEKFEIDDELPENDYDDDVLECIQFLYRENKPKVVTF